LYRFFDRTFKTKKEGIAMTFGWLILIGSAIIVLGGFALVYFILAPRNLFFTFVSEGTAKAVVKGDAFCRFLMVWENHRFKEDGSWEVIEGKTRKRLFGGLVFYGIPPIHRIWSYPFSWINYTHDGKIQEHSKRWIDYVLLKEDVYYFKVEKAEDVKRLPLDVDVIIVARVVNPYKALFMVENWLEATINLLRPAVRDTITKAEFEILIKSIRNIGDRIYEELNRPNGAITLIKNRYGVEVLDLQIVDINPPPEYREATLKEFEAEQKRKAIVVEASAEVARLEAVYKAIQEFGDLGRLIRTLEAIEKSNLAAALSVHAVPGLSEALKGVFGHSEVSSEEIKQLRGALIRLNEAIQELKGDK